MRFSIWKSGLHLGSSGILLFPNTWYVYRTHPWRSCEYVDKNFIAKRCLFQRLCATTQLQCHFLPLIPVLKAFISGPKVLKWAFFELVFCDFWASAMSDRKTFSGPKQPPKVLQKTLLLFWCHSRNFWKNRKKYLKKALNNGFWAFSGGGG